MRISWNWIHGRSDLFWYIGSALFGWIYLGAVFFLGRGLNDPLRDPFYRVDLFGLDLALTLGLVVVASWAVLVDAPHVWATLARTWLDPDEWSERRGMLLGSTLWFAVGPLAVFGPYALGAIVPAWSPWSSTGAAVFFVLFRLWAYYHVVRQHWGFLVLYKRANDDWSDPLDNLADRWFFNAALYLPLIAFVSAPWYASTGMPPLGLSFAIVPGMTIGSMLHPAALGAYALSLSAYAWLQVRQYRRGRRRNGPKLLLLLAIAPLHLAVFLHPLLALFVVPIVTVGHNLQYHRIVWVFGRNRYRGRTEPRFRWARAAFGSVGSYFALGLLFTFACYQGPVVAMMKEVVAAAFDRGFVTGVGLIAGTVPPDAAGLGGRVAAALFLGWAMQHYYLDAKIWRVRRDPLVARYLDR